MKEYYRRNLPHIHLYKAVFFITFRLHGSLPEFVLKQLMEEFNTEKELKRLRSSNLSITKIPSTFYQRYFETFDSFLDTQHVQNRWLADERIAQIVMDAILYRDTKAYELICFTIMPNHVHMLIEMQKNDNNMTDDHLVNKSNTRLSTMLHSLKRYTAYHCNKLLRREGAFWQSESYDRVVRNEKELDYTVQYILNNPVKAGLVKVVNDWKFSYCKYPL